MGDPLLTTHFDVTPPSVSITSPTDGSSITDPAVTINWTMSDNSGISCCKLLLNNTLNYTGLDTVYTVELAEGDWEIKITAQDTSGNVGTAKILITVAEPSDGTTIEELLGQFIAFVTSPIGMLFTVVDVVFLVTIVLTVRRRRR